MQEQTDVLDILEQLKDELNVPGGFFSKKPDIDLCCDLCDKLSRMLPTALKDAEYINQRRKEILENADGAAKNTLRAAEEKAKKLVSETEIVKNAQIAAQQIIENAYAQCDNLILRTKTHLDGMFKDIDNFLCSTLSVVRTNREELRAVRINGSDNNRI